MNNTPLEQRARELLAAEYERDGRQPTVVHSLLNDSLQDLGIAHRHSINAISRALGDRTDWQPIETAPKDGTEFDAWRGGEFPGRVPNVSWREPTDSEWWVHGGDTLETPDATWHDCFGPIGKIEPLTHWQPVPKPPDSIASGAHLKDMG